MVPDLANRSFAASDVMDVTIGGERVRISSETLAAYDRPGPRYTSYPTAPEWNDDFGAVEWEAAVTEGADHPGAPPVSLYLHLPFCRSLCLYCGCNVVISKDTTVSGPYLERLEREIDRLGAALPSRRRVEQMHWGGGTPTYLSIEQIERLCGHLRGRFSFAPDAEVSIEVDPRATSPEQCAALRRLGFNRLSLGIQDFDPTVQRTVRRVQPFEATRELIAHCRSLGFDGINVDLIYGLPHQSVRTFGETLDRVIALDPDRIAVFSYAHVPWLKRQQGSFTRHLPPSDEKFRIFSTAIRALVGAGYRYVGLDHFARPDDDLCRAQDDRTLHRNFQGYTTQAGCDLHGLGMSAISALEDVYAQNQRDLAGYYRDLDSGRWPTQRGLRVTPEDKLRRSVINRILCHGVVVKAEVERTFGVSFDDHFAAELVRLGDLERDGLVRLSADRIDVAGLGRIFLRNVAMTFNAYLNDDHASPKPIYSRTL